MFTPPASQLSRNSSNKITTFGNVILETIAISMNSRIIYKCTPLGKLLHIRFWWNKNNITNLNEENNEIFDYATASYNPSYEHDEEHYIGYHSA
ncbi:hypothetical protein PVMG_06139 [Plasmodium vivax Mauritania I]|uniref:Uncharacterized protein n=1 Tax=Plasmodium vivax Mauritania I TaxID=1035515 RepID=A0A0J9TBW7_PLAVI|nr:hypothetical protein PVMG_06139 [Plasmodium vivax Mauritania I]